MTDKPIYASITLTQEGNNGEIAFSTKFSKNAGDAPPASHQALAQLVAVFLQLQTFNDDEKSTINEKFSCSLKLEQEESEGPVFASITMDPKVAPSMDQPTSYGIISYLFNMWLYMVGVINEDGDLEDEDYLELLQFDVRPASVTLN